ncbi:MAG TPA: hypothetical protein VKQ71_03645 [Acidimicrobiales bacterium]|nr:hypothetical protein [Acidimicrobiales bacterium]
MFDAITAANIPLGAGMVAGYDDGRYAWPAADWARFPSAVKVHITVFAADNIGEVLDVEAGDASPDQAPGWCQARRAAGVDPSVYCSVTALASVQAAFARAGVPEPHYWLAAYPGIGAAIYAGTYAHQYADIGPYDLSAVAAFWPGIDAVVVPASEGDPLMSRIAFDAKSGGTWTIKPDGSVYAHDGAPYLGGLNGHPDWHAGLASDPAVGIAPWPGDGTDAAGNGYVVETLELNDATGDPFRLYHFPGNGVYK